MKNGMPLFSLFLFFFFFCDHLFSPFSFSSSSSFVIPLTGRKRNTRRERGKEMGVIQRDGQERGKEMGVISVNDGGDLIPKSF